MRRVVLAAVAVAFAFGAWAARARLDAFGPAPSSQELLYLPNGKYLRLASFGESSLLADAVYVWAIQFYSDYERADRYRYVEHVFGNVIAELDPNYIDPYWLGALILTLEAHDLEGGLRVLETGFRNNPDAWVLMYLAGWESESAGRHDLAASYFGRAAAVPGAPARMRRLQAGMEARAGDLQTAYAMWQAMLDEPGVDSATKAIAERQVRDLSAKLDVHALQKAVDAFHGSRGRMPRTLEDLVAAGYLSAVPRDPDGAPYAYDPGSGRVTSRFGAVLGGR